MNSSPGNRPKLRTTASEKPVARQYAEDAIECEARMRAEACAEQAEAHSRALEAELRRLRRSLTRSPLNRNADGILLSQTNSRPTLSLIEPLGQASNSSSNRPSARKTHWGGKTP